LTFVARSSFGRAAFTLGAKSNGGFSPCPSARS
jgi:hypothetical protein